MEHDLLTMIILVAAIGVATQWAAWRVGLPAIVVLLAVGFLLGPVTSLVQPEADFGAILRPAISVAVAIVVLEEALNLDFAELRAAGRGIWRMAAIGIPLGWAFGAAAAHYVAGLSWPIAVLLGAMLVITGPTVIAPLLRETKLARRPASYLQWEGMLNDAAGAVLTVLTLEFLLAFGGEAVEATVFDVAVGLVTGAAVGSGLGIAAAFLTRFLFVHGHSPAFLKAPMVLAAALLIYGVTDMVQHEAGLIGVAAYGIALANMGLTEIEDLKRFKQGASVFLVSGLFIVVAAMLPAETLGHIRLPELAFVATVLFLVRPAAMLLATVGSGMPWRERLFVAMVAPRGIVAAALASLATARLYGAGYEGSELILPLVFAIMAGTVLLHGLLMGPFARMLGLAAPARPGVILVGSNPWTVALARTLKSLGTPVLLSDRSARALETARAQALEVHEGHILSPAPDHPDQLEGYEFLLAATDSDAFNALVCLRFAPDLGTEHVYQTAFAEGALGLDPQWRGRPLGTKDMTIDILRERLSAGWDFFVEEVASADSQKSIFESGRDRLPIALVAASGALVFASPEAKLAAPGQGRLIVFRASPGPAA